MSSPKPTDKDQPRYEEIEWTEEDEQAADRAMAKLRKRWGGKLPSQIEREREEERNKHHEQ